VSPNEDAVTLLHLVVQAEELIVSQQKRDQASEEELDGQCTTMLGRLKKKRDQRVALLSSVQEDRTAAIAEFKQRVVTRTAGASKMFRSVIGSLQAVGDEMEKSMDEWTELRRVNQRIFGRTHHELQQIEDGLAPLENKHPEVASVSSATLTEVSASMDDLENSISDLAPAGHRQDKLESTAEFISAKKSQTLQQYVEASERHESALKESVQLLTKPLGSLQKSCEAIGMAYKSRDSAADTLNTMLRHAVQIAAPVVYEFTGAQKFKQFVNLAVKNAVDDNSEISELEAIPPEQAEYITTLPDKLKSQAQKMLDQAQQKVEDAAGFVISETRALSVEQYRQGKVHAVLDVVNDVAKSAASEFVKAMKESAGMHDKLGEMALRGSGMTGAAGTMRPGLKDPVRQGRQGRQGQQAAPSMELLATPTRWSLRLRPISTPWPSIAWTGSATRPTFLRGGRRRRRRLQVR